ncbi:tyrosine-type recombinase/integrase [Euzebya sp.]|uniref:tyrosine-type recombinase/integrase n=1 Tax=Euzebya sp. TaxID=1971409 RepID=UPI0035143737
MGRVAGEGGLYWSDSRQRWVAAWKGRKRYAHTQTEAAAKLRALKAAEGQRARTVGQLIDWWTDEHLPMRLANDDLAAATVRDYTHSMQLWAPLRRTRLETLTAADIDRRLEQLRKARTTRGTGYSASKRRGALVALRQAFKAARRAGLLPPGRTAPEDATPPPVRTTEPPLVDTTTAAAVLGQLAGDRDLRLIIVTLALGLRISETLGLTWDDIDLDAGTIRIHAQLERRDGVWQLKDRTKGKNDVTLALPKVASAALREQRAAQAAERLAAGDLWADQLGLVFTRADGQPVWSTLIVKKIGRACEAAGVERMTTHQFTRHGHATLLRLAGANLDDIREQLRHSQTSTTERYAHVLPEVRRRTAGLIDDVLG